MNEKFYCLSSDFNEQEFIKEREKTHLRTFIKEKNLVVDSILVCDKKETPYETMIFKTDDTGFISFDELYVERYKTRKQMKKRHFEIVEYWREI